MTDNKDLKSPTTEHLDLIRQLLDLMHEQVREQEKLYKLYKKYEDSVEKYFKLSSRAVVRLSNDII